MKRIIALLLVLMMIVSVLTACGEADKKEDASGEGTTETTAADTTEKAKDTENKEEAPETSIVPPEKT